ncbi:MAG TPA: hypothetical protein PKJ99_10250 [Thermoanaerobaculales bacterium]|nr:hypothetical protein [Thermoanaerobaculales bacterium]HPA80651.1 hypothetical protein [Thermoanaerobaculales bacterium]HQL30929.1 hypothetical protein [Thermoanaerobaculales bacterium]HQN97011.1 hypothetical protein [Thermoanaerobaculales bacterium]HQP43285.1 hypothetical protein [Thermoanaerobaculales bacterium]
MVRPAPTRFAAPSLLVLLLGLALTPPAEGSCPSSQEPVSLDEVVARVERDGVRYAFVGEQHGIGPVKRFAVDLANALVDRGQDVGLYVEGFRTDCQPRDEACASLSHAFNRAAFLALLDNSRAPVHPLDPPGDRDRAATMAALVAGGSEAIKVVLVGRSHVIFAGDPDAVHHVFGGAMPYPDPGDVAEAFPRDQTLTFTLLDHGDGDEPYRLRRDGCRGDYLVSTAPSRQY